uniref:Uncharacterized protein n=1 Tax=Romanomermis culicivorax TaxID=13658 RepID=A0A915KK23_ROMCU
MRSLYTEEYPGCEQAYFREFLAEGHGKGGFRIRQLDINIRKKQRIFIRRQYPHPPVDKPKAAPEQAHFHVVQTLFHADFRELIVHRGLHVEKS